VLGVSSATVYRLCDDGQLVHVRVANSVRVRHEDLGAFVGDRREE
jgi:excisionase family DNA binding protein